MKLGAYLFTINKNNFFKLDTDELKDVEQEINIYLFPKSYNDLLIKKTILSFYLSAVKKKIRNEELISTAAYLNNHEPGSYEIELKRKEKMKALNLNKKQSKIIDLLISGFSYKEICRKMRIKSTRLAVMVSRIKEANQANINNNVNHSQAQSL